MRSLIAELVHTARRETRMHPAAPFTINTDAPNGLRLAGDAIRMARLATAMHLDQATQLRMQFAERALHAERIERHIPRRVFTSVQAGEALP